MDDNNPTYIGRSTADLTTQIVYIILSRLETYHPSIMEINWRAVLTGFVVAIVLGIVVAWVSPPAETSGLALALPGLVGGFVAGYMVSGIGNGAVHGGLSTIVGALFVLLALTVFGILFVGLIPALGGATIALLALFAMAIPGAIAGALGGWMKGRRAPRPATGAAPR